MSSYPEDDNIALLLGLPADDILLLQHENIWYQALPVILYLVAYAFMFLCGYVVHAYVAIVSCMLSPLVNRSRHLPALVPLLFVCICADVVGLSLDTVVGK